MQEEINKTPNWLLFIFFACLGIGLLYIIFLHGFYDYQSSHEYREASGSIYVKAKLAIVPKRTKSGIERGKRNYERTCVACHGAYGNYTNGLTGPDLSDSQWLHVKNEKGIAPLVMEGINESKSITKQIMPARGGAILNDRDIWEIIYYISSKNSSIAQDAEATE